MREALAGATRFSGLRSTLRIAPDVLSARLGILVKGGVMERRTYRVPGSRSWESYHLTDAGHDLAPVPRALQQWGDLHRSSDLPRLRFTAAGGRAVSVRFVDEDGNVLDREEVRVDGSGPPAGALSRSHDDVNAARVTA